MRTEDMQDIIDAAVGAHLLSQGAGEQFMANYHELRDEKEREADAHAAQVLERSWFERILFWRVPVIGVPAVFVGLIGWVVLSAVLK